MELLFFYFFNTSNYFPLDYFLGKIIGGVKKIEKGWRCEHPNRPIGERCEQGEFWGDFKTREECELFCGKIREDELVFNIDGFEKMVKNYAYVFPIPIDFLERLKTSKNNDRTLWNKYENFYNIKLYDQFRTILMINPYIYYTDFTELIKKIINGKYLWKKQKYMEKKKLMDHWVQ